MLRDTRRLASALTIAAAFLLPAATTLALQVTGFTLVNAATDADIGALADGAAIDTGSTGSALNIRADTSGSVGSVVFSLSGTQSTTRTESVAPFALFGDSSGNFAAWSPAAGAYTLTATPWSGTGGSGTAGPALTVAFTVNQGTAQFFTLNVSGGSGSGSYAAGSQVPISAAAPPPGQAFTVWSGDTAGVTDPGAATTTFTMPAAAASLTAGFATPADGDGSVTVSGEARRWHTLTFTLAGPWSSETASPNPFTDHRLSVTFLHPATGRSHTVPGFFAADGNAAATGATSGNHWKVRFTPGHAGTWTWRLSFVTGPGIAVSDAPGSPLPPFDGSSGSFDVAESDKAEPDFRALGRLTADGSRYLRFLGTGDHFLKVGADSPENLLNDRGFDGTRAGGSNDRTRLWEPHVGDWRPGDPSWRGSRGHGIIGALNYLADQGMNAFSFLTFNVGGDSNDVWPFIAPAERLRYDCSKLDQWDIVFTHAQRRGLFLHFKLQETEVDNGPDGLDGGDLGPERRLYFRELVARFGHHLALNWNLGEENSQTTAQRKAMAAWFAANDPFHHPVVIHTFPGQKDAVYGPLLGAASDLHGASLQSDWQAVHADTLEWIRRSTAAGKPWICANDEQGSAGNGIPPDPGWPGYNGGGPSRTDLRHRVIWGHLLAGGAGIESYFGYSHPESDLTCDDFRSRHGWWAQLRHAHRFLTRHTPFWRMQPADALVGNAAEAGSGAFCLAAPGDCYAVYVPAGAATPALDLSAVPGSTTLQVRWFDPRNGGNLQTGSVTSVSGGGPASLGSPPSDTSLDWVALVHIPRSILFIRGGNGSGGFLEGGSDEQLGDITNPSTAGGNHGWKEWADTLRADGFEPAQVIEGSAPDGSPVDLTSVDLSRHAVIVLGSNNATYTDAAVDAIEAFVRSGGGLLVISDANFGSSWSDAPSSDQPFLDRFGLLMHQDTGTYTLQRASGDFLAPAHPVLDAVAAFDGEGVSPVRLLPPPPGVTRSALTVAKGSIRLNNAPGAGSTVPATAADTALAVATAGRGRLAASFDRNTFFNLNGAGTSIHRFDNRTYALNLIHWLAGFPSTTAASYAAWSSGIDWGATSRNPLADDDGDGLRNADEFSFDRDPLLPDDDAVLDLSRSLDTFHLDVRLRSGRRGIVEFSGDLAAWFRIQPPSGGSAVTVLDPDPDGDGSAIHWRFHLPVALTGDQPFLRVTVDPFE